MIFVQPIECVVDEKLPDCISFRAVEVNALAPGGMMTIGKELWSVTAEVISYRAKVVVDDIQQNHNSPAVGGLNQVFKVLRPAITAVWSVWIDTVITPISPARKVADRHQLQRCHSEICKIVELLARGGKGTARREGSNMKFVDNSFFPLTATPRLIEPAESIGIDNFTRAVHVPRLKPGSGIWDLLPTINAKTVLGSCLCRISY